MDFVVTNTAGECQIGADWSFTAGGYDSSLAPDGNILVPSGLQRAEFAVQDAHILGKIEFSVEIDPFNGGEPVGYLLPTAPYAVKAFGTLTIGEDSTTFGDPTPVTVATGTAEAIGSTVQGGNRYYTYAFTLPGGVSIRGEYGTRLVYALEEYNRNGWGPTWEQAGEIRDLRPWLYAALKQRNWGTGGYVTITAFGTTWTLEQTSAADADEASQAIITCNAQGCGRLLSGNLSLTYGGTGMVTCSGMKHFGVGPALVPWTATAGTVTVSAFDDVMTGRQLNGDVPGGMYFGATFSPAWNVEVAPEFLDSRGKPLGHGLNFIPTAGPVSASGMLPYTGATFASDAGWKRTLRNYTIDGGMLDYWLGSIPPNVREDSRDDTPIRFGWTLSPAELTAADLEPNAWRCPVQLPLEASWEYGRIYMAPEWVADECASTDGWSSDGSVSYDGGVKCTGSAGRYLEKTFAAADACFGSTRYLEISATTSGAGKTGTLTIGTKTWNFSSDAANATLLFDLLAPNNLSGIDYSQTLNETPGWGWGIESPAVLNLTFDDADAWTLTEVRFYRLRYQNFLGQNEMLANIEPFKTDDEDDIYLRRGLVFLSEGKIVVDEPMGEWNDTTQEATAYTIDDIIGMSAASGLYERLGGIGDKGVVGAFNNDYDSTTQAREAIHSQYLDLSNTVDYYTPSQYFNNGADAYHMLPVAYAPPVDTSGESEEDSAALSACWQVDMLELGVGVTPAELVVTKVFSGFIHGITADDEAGALNGVPVDVSDGATYTCTSSRGLYASPSLHKTGPWTVDAGAVGSTGSVSTIWHGTWPRVCLPGEIPDTGEGISHWASVTGTLYRAYGVGGNVLLDTYGPTGISSARVLFAGSQPSIVGFDDEVTRPIRIYYTDSGDIYRRDSTDNAATWGSAVSIVSSATRPCACYDPQSRLVYLAYLDASNNVKVAQSTDRGQTFGSAVTAVAGADDDWVSLSVVVRVDPGTGKRLREIFVSYRDGGNIEAVKSTDNGASWSTI